ncbi:putative DNA binding domain-containing protein [Elizabethkingia anophelis]|uniref:RNA-binding domain-containing protein n=1 Tax=Elizabethkingia anophelis TaxID=1117645 RepID=UPI0018C27CD7|nr:RNA-binding domain-containing protein [Elizabethkingia anophelis]MBG0506508.1 putative DNA binding domain-containing protein [Elizabethkingia anophelis]
MALPINIEDLINARTVESVRIEFKRGWNPYNILRTVCAFSNDINEYGGGYIVIGIEEKDGSPILPPFGVEQKDIDNIQKEFFKLCKDNIRENVFPVIEPIELQGKWIIVIWVTTGEQRPYLASDSPGKNAQMKIFVRHGAVTKEANKEQELTLRELAAFKHFDDRLNAKANIDDLDLGLIQSYLQEIKSTLYEEANKITLQELALKMQIARGTAENLKPLNVGLLMFCKNPEKYFEGCVTNLVEFEDEAGTKYSEKTFMGPVHVQIRLIIDYLSNNVIKEFVRKDASQPESIRFVNYPYQALEEAVVNSLYHRSYDNPTPNEIRIYKAGNDRRIEILSYPGPLPPIDENALVQLNITARNYRNLKLGDWLKNLRLAEKYATGIPTILSALHTNGSPKPILSTDADRSHFLVVFRIHPDAPEETNNTTDEIETFTLSNNQQIILEKISNEPVFETEIESLFDTDISDDLDSFITSGLIGIKQSDNSKIFFITPKGKNALKSSF